MSVAPETRNQIETMIRSDRVVLFMKGTREAPQCGFSMQVVRILDDLIPTYSTVDVLSDGVVRQGIKDFSDWPTIPQLYVDGEFLGGCDIVKEMYSSGELQEALGVPGQTVTSPKIEISDRAAEALRQAQSQADYPDLHLGIDARFQYSLGFGPREPGAIEVEASGLRVLLSPQSARRANGLRLDMKDTPRGPQLSVYNPNEPKVQSITPAELKTLRESGTPFELIDVRTTQERERASIEGSLWLDAEGRRHIEALPKDTKLVFHCHSGVRSRSAAQEFAALGFEDVSNLEGGIDAWSREIDSSVPRY